MKRVGNLMAQITDYDNLQLAFLKSCRGKQAKREVLEFRANYDYNIREIRNGLLKESIVLGDYNYFKIYDPKERLICAASFRERVVHHAIMNVCHKYFDRSLIYDTYATREGKGGYKALEKAMAMASKYRFAVKLDYRKYFDSIDHDILKYKLRRLFKDKELLSLFYRIIDSYEVTQGKGLPIGNLTSQYFANYYLSSIDHKMKEKLNVPVYIRYMDDILMMDNDKNRLVEYVSYMRIESLSKLRLNLKEPVFNACRIGIPFLGYVVMPYRLKLSGYSKKRFRKKVVNSHKLFLNGEYSEQEYQRHLLPLLAFANKAECMSFKKIVRESVEGLKSREPWWQLEQQCEELPSVESQQQHS